MLDKRVELGVGSAGLGQKVIRLKRIAIHITHTLFFLFWFERVNGF